MMPADCLCLIQEIFSCPQLRPDEPVFAYQSGNAISDVYILLQKNHRMEDHDIFTIGNALCCVEGTNGNRRKTNSC